MGSPLGRSAGAALLVLAFASLPACGRDLPDHVERATKIEVATLDPPPGALTLPVENGSVRFAVIGDSGRGDTSQHEVARQMSAWRATFPFDFVLMLGDNIYDRHTPADYVRKFEEPYRPLLESGVTFYAAIGNHDDPGQVNYERFNMRGERYYTFRKAEQRLEGLAGAGVRFFALDSRSFDPGQLDWVRRELKSSGSAWKICFFHHPLYTSGRYQAGARTLRQGIESILVEGDVDVVLTGHEHFYERLHPQHGIAHFISGAAGSLRRGDLRQTRLTARGFDTDHSFLMMEVSGDRLFFQAVSRTGETIDAGVITRRR